MTWLYSAVLYVHILGAIFWVGSAMMFQFVFVPSLGGMPFEAQRPWLQALATRYGPVVGASGALTLAFGVLRGVLTGVLGILRTLYGVTWLMAIALGIPVAVVGGALIGPTGNRMAAAHGRDEVLALGRRMSIYGRLEFAGMLLLLALMVAMHAGY